MLFEDIDRQVVEHESTVLIIDNISYLTRGSTANASVAFRLMERLQNLKRDRFISILLIAHTPKKHRFGHLTENEMQGSIDLSKAADSIIALGRSRRSPDLRYLKQIKYRSGRVEHGSDNVALFRLHKFDFAARLGTKGVDIGHDNFLGFDFVGFDKEENHFALRFKATTRRRGRTAREVWKVQQAKTLAGRGMSSSAVASELGVSKATANRYINLAQR